LIEKVCEQAREEQPRLNGAARCVMKSWLKNSSYDHSKAFRKQAAHFKTACWIADQSNMNNLEIIMNRYRLIIRNNDRLLGHFESAVPGAQDAMQEVARCLSAAGYGLELLVADSERRLLDSGPDGIRVLSSEPIFKSTPLDYR